MKKINPIKKHIPKDPLMAMAWHGFISFSIGSSEIMSHFRKDTGNTYEPAKTPIDQMVDDATGHSADFLDQFLGWLNKNYWGLDFVKSVWKLSMYKDFKPVGFDRFRK
jgi:hypothetical protein